MKVIVDTCVWSLSLRRRDPTQSAAGEQRILSELKEMIQNRRAAIIGPIRQEVLSGLREKTQFAKTQALLEPFRDEVITAGDYVEAARLYNVCRDCGVECGAVDILICAVAVRMQFGILTSDKGLKRCAEALRYAGHLLRCAGE